MVAARARGRAIARTEHRLGWEYAVLDVPALRAHLDAGLAAAGVAVRAGRAVGLSGPGTVALAAGPSCGPGSWWTPGAAGSRSAARPAAGSAAGRVPPSRRPTA